MLPGHEVILVEAGRPRSSRTDTGVAFFVGESERGPTAPTLVSSLAEFTRTFGVRVSYSYLYDAVESFFREGGALCWIARVVGDVPVAASVVLDDAAAADTLRVRAKSTGTWGNSLTVQVLAGDAAGSFRLRIRGVSDAYGEGEDSPDLADKAAALAWAQNTARWVELDDLASVADPAVVAATPLAAGDDDRDTIDEANWTAALGRFGADLGSGQVAAPGRTTNAAHLALLEHARTRNRHALLDLPDSATVATVTSAARAADAAPNSGGRRGSAYWPWAVVPGYAGGASLRTVPYSAVQAGLAARVDTAGNPGEPVAGERKGATRWAIGLSRDTSTLTDADREAMNDAGVNVALQFYGGRGPVTYGNRTLRLAESDPLWVQASVARAAMALAARGGDVIRRYVHTSIDGKGRKLGQLAGELGAVCAELHTAGALFGDSPEEAASVDTGPGVNPLEDVQAGLIRAAVSARFSPGADRVVLELLTVPITEEVA